MESLYQAYRERGVVVLGIDLQETQATVRQFVNQGKYSWTFALDSRGLVSDDYHVTALPTSLFIDGTGVIRAKHIGSMTRAAMEAGLAKALK